MTTSVTWQLRVTQDSVRNSCDVCDYFAPEVLLKVDVLSCLSILNLTAKLFFVGGKRTCPWNNIDTDRLVKSDVNPQSNGGPSSVCVEILMFYLWAAARSQIGRRASSKGARRLFSPLFSRTSYFHLCFPWTSGSPPPLFRLLHHTFTFSQLILLHAMLQCVIKHEIFQLVNFCFIVFLSCKI